MPESVDRIDGQTASDIISYQNGNYGIYLLSRFFLSFFIICLTLTSFLTDFELFFFFFTKILSLFPSVIDSLSSVLMQNESLISVVKARLD